MAFLPFTLLCFPSTLTFLALFLTLTFALIILQLPAFSPQTNLFLYLPHPFFMLTLQTGNLFFPFRVFPVDQPHFFFQSFFQFTFPVLSLRYPLLMFGFLFSFPFFLTQSPIPLRMLSPQIPFQVCSLVIKP